MKHPQHKCWPRNIHSFSRLNSTFCYVKQSLANPNFSSQDRQFQSSNIRQWVKSKKYHIYPYISIYVHLNTALTKTNKNPASPPATGVPCWTRYGAGAAPAAVRPAARWSQVAWSWAAPWRRWCWRSLRPSWRRGVSRLELRLEDFMLDS